MREFTNEEWQWLEPWLELLTSSFRLHRGANYANDRMDLYVTCATCDQKFDLQVTRHDLEAHQREHE